MRLAHSHQLGKTVDRKATRLRQRGQLIDEPLLRPTLRHRCRFAAKSANPLGRGSASAADGTGERTWGKAQGRYGLTYKVRDRVERADDTV